MNWVGANQQWLFMVFSMQDNLSVIGFSRKNAQGIGNHRIQVGLLLNLGIAPALEQFSKLLDDRRGVVIGAANVDHGFLYLTEFRPVLAE